MNDNLPDYDKTTGSFKSMAYCQIIDTTIPAKAGSFDFGSDSRNRWDLFPICAILATSSWNKNLDVFTPPEMWMARHSSEDKPFNFMHDCSDIIGHITDNITVDSNMQVVAENTPVDQLPGIMHIVTKSVLYKFWDKAEQQEKINKLISEINTGKWFVSMECLFKDFAYILKDSSGSQKVLARNNETSFLTRKLKQYGGDGTYQGYTIGRLLKDITFSAVGLVDNPANPDSIISIGFNEFFNNLQTLGYITLEQLNKETCMAEIKESVATLSTFNVEDNAAYKLLKAELENTKAKLDEVSKKVIAEKDEDMEDMKKECAELKAKLAAAEKDKEDWKKEKADTEDDMAEAAKAAKTEYDKVVSELDAEKKTRQAYEDATRKAKRGAAIISADASLTKAQVEDLLTKFSALADPVFAAMIETIKGYASKAPKDINKSSAEDVVNKGVTTASTKPEDDMPLGVTSEDKFKTVASDIASWYKKNDKGSK